MESERQGKQYIRKARVKKTVSREKYGVFCIRFCFMPKQRFDNCIYMFAILHQRARFFFKGEEVIYPVCWSHFAPPRSSRPQSSSFRTLIFLFFFQKYSCYTVYLKVLLRARVSIRRRGTHSHLNVFRFQHL